MSNEKVVIQGPSIGFAGLLTLLFIGLKLGGVISWSYWWVLSPLWISAGVILLVLLVIFFALIVGEFMKK